jgi:TolB-like protein
MTTLTTLVLVSVLGAGDSDVSKSVANVVEQLQKQQLPKTVLLPPISGSADEAMRFKYADILKEQLGAAGVSVVDRDALKAVLEESSVSGELAQDALVEMAGGFGAGALLVGELSVETSGFAISIRIVNTESGEMMGAASGKILTPGVTETIEGEMDSVQAQLRRLADALAGGIAQKDPEARYHRFAVLPFQEIGATTKEKELGTVVSAEITTLLARDHGLILVERAQLATVVDELALGQSGLVDESKSAQIGKMVGAHALVMGTVSEVGGHYDVNAKVVSTETALMLYTAKTQLPAADLVALSSEAVVLRSTTGAIYRSLLLPGWGQFYNRQPIKASVFVGAEVASIAAAAYFHSVGAKKEKRYNNLGGGADFERVINKAEDAYQRRNTLIYIAIGIHALNLIDAVLSAKSFDSASPSSGGGGFSLGW